MPRKWLFILPEQRLSEVNSFKVTRYKAGMETVCNWLSILCSCYLANCLYLLPSQLKNNNICPMTLFSSLHDWQVSCPLSIEEYLLEEFAWVSKGLIQWLCYALLTKAFGNPTSCNFDFLVRVLGSCWGSARDCSTEVESRVTSDASGLNDAEHEVMCTWRWWKRRQRN